MCERGMRDARPYRSGAREPRFRHTLSVLSGDWDTLRMSSAREAALRAVLPNNPIRTVLGYFVPL